MKKLLLTLIMSFMAFTSHAQATFDVNQDGKVSVSDVMMVVNNILFGSNSQNALLCDVNQDGKVTVSDAMMVVNIILHGYNSFSVAPTSVSIPFGGTATLEIIGGYNNYEVISANTDVVEATLSGTTITLSAVSSGETKVTIKDLLSMRYVDIPVTVEYPSIQLSSSELSLIAGKEGMVDIISGSGNYSVESSDVSVATVQVTDGKITVSAIAAGIATITVTDIRSGQMTILEVSVIDLAASLCPDDNHPHMIDLGLPSGTKWACCNVDTDHPESQSPTNNGGYYAWGETEEKSVYNEVTYQYCTGIDYDGDGWYHDEFNLSDEFVNLEYCDLYQSLGSTIIGTECDVAHVKWGDAWQMPSFNQIEELLDNCKYSWECVNGTNGYLFTGKNGSSIFLPLAGCRYNTNLDDLGTRSVYWSGTPDMDSEYRSNTEGICDYFLSWGLFHDNMDAGNYQ